MTLRWSLFAASLTDRPVKGMLTGPVTMLQWSFVRDDQPEPDTARQVALALRDEVADLEAAGVRIIQIDYAPVFLSDRSVAVLGQAGVLQPVRLDGQREDNIRFSFGVTF